jgi:hypothetical protein
VAEVDSIGTEKPWEVLHVGCGGDSRDMLPEVFRRQGWQEVRLDIDPEVHPDFVASITERVIPDKKVDAVYSSHNVEHLYPHEVQDALRGMRRVLKPSGFAFVIVSDLQEVARHVAEGMLDAPLYLSPMGPIAPIDILFGHRPSLAANNLFMAHRTGFTAHTLASALLAAGFSAVLLQQNPAAYCLTPIAFLSPPREQDLAMAQAQMAPGYAAVLYVAQADENIATLSSGGCEKI